MLHSGVHRRIKFAKQLSLSSLVLLVCEGLKQDVLIRGGRQPKIHHPIAGTPEGWWVVGGLGWGWGRVCTTVQVSFFPFLVK